VEAKCFAEGSAETNEMYTAIGQYLVYRSWLKPKGLADNLYLAIPKSAYDGIFSRMGMAAVTENAIKMIVVDLEKRRL
jgi:XisH protein